MDLHGLMRDRPGDWSTDCPLQVNAWFVCRTDRPMVLYEVTSASSWDRSTDGPLKANAWFILRADRPMVP